jgi:pimeloyl-ACP methyl ester carboxylesterase
MMNPSIEILQHPSGPTVIYRYMPPAPAACEQGVLLIPSAPWDTMRLSWFYRQCCEQLTKIGYHVYRFDLRGTGDSPYPTADQDPVVWLRETEAVRDSLRSQVRRLHAVGPRFAGYLAALSAESYAYRSLHVIDPVLNLAAYSDELDRIQNRFLAEHNRFGSELRTDAEILGFPKAMFHTLIPAELTGIKVKTKRVFLYLSPSFEPPERLITLWYDQEREVAIVRTSDHFSWSDPSALLQQCFCRDTLKQLIHQLEEV